MWNISGWVLWKMHVIQHGNQTVFTRIFTFFFKKLITEQNVFQALNVFGKPSKRAFSWHLIVFSTDDLSLNTIYRWIVSLEKKLVKKKTLTKRLLYPSSYFQRKESCCDRLEIGTSVLTWIQKEVVKRTRFYHYKEAVSYWSIFRKRPPCVFHMLTTHNGHYTLTTWRQTVRHSCLLTSAM